MLMLILIIAITILSNLWHFNTSHVNVNLSIGTNSKYKDLYFNTSHVNVNQMEHKEFAYTLEFQYISC